MQLTPDQITIIGLMLAIGVAGLSRVWVFGWTYRDRIVDLQAQVAEAKKERDEWRVIAVGSLEAAADVARVAKNHTTFSPEQAEQAQRVMREAGKG